jgi:hypothetical protein
MAYRSDWGGEPPTRHLSQGPQKHSRCKFCGRRIRLTQLPMRGPTWVHNPGEGARCRKLRERLEVSTSNVGGQ